MNDGLFHLNVVIDGSNKFLRFAGIVYFKWISEANVTISEGYLVLQNVSKTIAMFYIIFFPFLNYSILIIVLFFYHLAQLLFLTSTNRFVYWKRMQNIYRWLLCLYIFLYLSRSLYGLLTLRFILVGGLLRLTDFWLWLLGL